MFLIASTLKRKVKLAVTDFALRNYHGSVSYTHLTLPTNREV